MQEGHINYNVRRAIALGMEPMQAIQMASINAAVTSASTTRWVRSRPDGWQTSCWWTI